MQSPSALPAPAAVVTFSAVLSGTVADFNQMSFKTRLAATLEGVTPSHISLTVMAASVRVTASINATSAAIANSTMATLSNFTAVTLSAALGGLTVESIAQPSLAWSADASSGVVDSASDQSTIEAVEGMMAEHIVLVVVVSVGVLLTSIILALCCCWFRGKPVRSMRKMDTSRSSRPFDTFESMDMSTIQPMSIQPMSISSPPPSAQSKGSVSSTSGALERARSAKANSTTKAPPNPFFDIGGAFEKNEFEDPRLRL